MQPGTNKIQFLKRLSECSEIKFHFSLKSIIEPLIFYFPHSIGQPVRLFGDIVSNE
jgi:hypothetical protein